MVGGPPRGLRPKGLFPTFAVTLCPHSGQKAQATRASLRQRPQVRGCPWLGAAPVCLRLNLGQGGIASWGSDFYGRLQHCPLEMGKPRKLRRV